MKRTKHLALVPAFAFLLACPFFAQENRGAKGHGKDAGQEEQGRMGWPPTFVTAPFGPEGIVLNEDGESLGVARDHFFHPRNGRVHSVVVGPAANDGPARRVPYQRFVWNVEEKRLVLPMSAEELEKLPEYVPEKQPAAGMAGKDKAHLAASEVLGGEILAGTAPFAAASELVLEPRSGVIAFVLARTESAETDPYVIPLTAMTWSPAKDDAKGRFTVAIDPERVAEAPKLEQGDKALLAKREVLERIHEFYGVSSPFASASQQQG